MSYVTAMVEYSPANKDVESKIRVKKDMMTEEGYVWLSTSYVGAAWAILVFCK